MCILMVLPPCTPLLETAPWRRLHTLLYSLCTLLGFAAQGELHYAFDFNIAQVYFKFLLSHALATGSAGSY